MHLLIVCSDVGLVYKRGCNRAFERKIFSLFGILTKILHNPVLLSSGNLTKILRNLTPLFWTQKWLKNGKIFLRILRFYPQQLPSALAEPSLACQGSLFFDSLAGRTLALCLWAHFHTKTLFFDSPTVKIGPEGHQKTCFFFC